MNVAIHLSAFVVCLHREQLIVMWYACACMCSTFLITILCTLRYMYIQTFSRTQHRYKCPGGYTFQLGSKTLRDKDNLLINCKHTTHVPVLLASHGMLNMQLIYSENTLKI